MNKEYNITELFGSYQIEIGNNKLFYDVDKDIINIIQTLQQENLQLKEMIDNQDGCNHRRRQIFDLKDRLEKVLKENKQLKGTLKEIKKYILKEMYVDREVVAGWLQFDNLLKMIERVDK